MDNPPQALGYGGAASHLVCQARDRGRVRQRIGAVMKWAVAQAYRDDNPAGGAISAALPRAAPGSRHSRQASPHGLMCLPGS